ncbi:WD40 repeat-like protein [Choiromyces venosus 120613-1]|uniref:WD40 repeat-like protein n=1 Tax=Choiromyces venosus 120613-1 TaxID=1336337 RepID=A0A3N4IYA8_9PEZI|nr:WD40 repeat-like protein [Choiromyces venosus 120613-1]
MSLLKPPKLVASTGTAYNCTVAETSARESPGQKWSGLGNSDEGNLFKSALWSPDGTCVLTNSEDNILRTFVLPVHLLDPSDEAKLLTPYSQTASAEPISCLAIYPFMSLAESATCCFLKSTRDHPIQLHDLLTANTRASYPLINPQTEKYLSPQSMLFTPEDANKFIVGSTSQISFFDLHRPGEGPYLDFKTIPTRRSVQTGETMKGIVSALAIDNGVLAAGTLSRQVGLYENGGSGSTIGVFTIDGEGGGITQLLWSKCGRYLHVVERKSDVISVYDVRVAGKKVHDLKGRVAETNQRIGVDIAYSLEGEVVSGGTDGMVGVWEAGGEGEKAFEWKAHDDVVSGAAIHPGGVVAATCSGTRNLGGLDEGSDDRSEERKRDNSLKIWAL